MSISTESCPQSPKKTPFTDANREAELFIDAVPSILIGLDAEGRIKRWNRAAAQTFDLPATSVMGKPLGICGIHWMTQDIDSAIHT